MLQTAEIRQIQLSTLFISDDTAERRSTHAVHDQEMLIVNFFELQLCLHR